jgi:glycosyltransferase involved in cell wall biosynthesis
MRVAFITGNYPTPSRPEHGTFVQQFVWAMARQGNECSVINPASLFDRRYGPYPPRQEIEDAGGGAHAQVYRPRYLSFSARSLGLIHTGRWTQRSLNRVARHAVAALPTPPDVVYGHFLYHAGRAAVVAGTSIGALPVIGVGEGTFWTVDAFGFARARRDFLLAGGFLAVASHIRDGLISKVGAAPENILLAPNGVDGKRFFPSDRGWAREQLGLPPSMFVVAFVGAFDDLKGGSKLVAAAEGLEGVGLVMLGKGETVFTSKRVVHAGTVLHEQVPVWLSGADIFVLPTLEEGSCNAVIEAMACGLPIVTSNGPYMDDIVDDEVAIRVDPTDVKAIRDAILALKNDPERRAQMSAACLRKAKGFDINARARRVTAWMEKLCQRHEGRL